MSLTANGPIEFAALTGCGLVTPLGAGHGAAVLDATDAQFKPKDAHRQRMISDAIVESLPALTGELARDRIGRMASAALTLAAQQAGLALPHGDPTRIGLVLSVAQAGQGGMIRFADEVRTQSPRFVSPIHFPETVGNYLAGALARAHGLRGPNLTVSGGASAGLEAFAEAAQMIQHGAADIVFVGGCEAWVPAMVETSLANHPVIAEATCFFVLERAQPDTARGARTLAQVRCQSLDSQAVDQALICACATGARANAICVEPWWGYAPSAAPFMAVAAVIAAATGHPVPICRQISPFCAEMRSLSDTWQQDDGELTALILPEPNAQGMSMLSVLIPARHSA